MMSVTYLEGSKRTSACVYVCVSSEREREGQRKGARGRENKFAKILTTVGS